MYQKKYDAIYSDNYLVQYKSAISLSDKMRNRLKRSVVCVSVGNHLEREIAYNADFFSPAVPRFGLTLVR